MNPIPSWAAILTKKSDSGIRLDYKFALDQAYSARVGPLPQFTRLGGATYVDSSGTIRYVGSNVPRIDYHPITGACRGLLMENQTNQYCVRSHLSTQFVLSGSTLEFDLGPSPDGEYNAGRVIETATTATHFTRSATTGSAALQVGWQVTVSAFVKKGTGATAPDWIALGFTVGLLSGRIAAFNISTGVVGSVAANTMASVVPYKNGWYRCIVTATVTTAGTWASSTNALIFTNNANTSALPSSYAGSVTSDVFVWGWQVELQQFQATFTPGRSSVAYATSYIYNPGTGTATRPYESAIIQGDQFSFYNPTVGTLAVKVSMPFVLSGGAASIAQYAAFAPTGEGFWLGSYTSTGESVQGYSASVPTVLCSTGSILPEFSRKGLSFRYELNNNALSVNGGAVIADNVGQIGTAATSFQMLPNPQYTINGWIESLEYYNVGLSDAELQTLSTP